MNSTRVRKSTLVLASLALALALLFFLNYTIARGGESAPPIDQDQYDELASYHLGDIYDLEKWAAGVQYDLLPIAPPFADFTWEQDGYPGLLPFTAQHFPSEFVKGLSGQYENSVPVYPVRIVEDRLTRALTFYNLDGEAIFRLPAASGYDPFAYLKETHAYLYGSPAYALLRAYYESLYDPARIMVKAKLIELDNLPYWLYAKAQIEAAEAEGLGGFEMLMGMQESTSTNIYFTDVQRLATGITMTVVFPSGFTNGLDIFTCNELPPSIWTLAMTNLPTTGTNLTWVDTNDYVFSGIPFRFYAAADATQDTDGDGAPDGREILVYGTDPTCPVSTPKKVSGSIIYGGTETGTIYVVFTTDSNSWSLAKSTALPGPGSYTNATICPGTSYYFKAFRDVNASYTRDTWEPWGLYSNVATLVTGDVSGIHITLRDQPSLWGQINYSGSATGDIHVVAVTQPNSWATNYEVVLPWTQGYGSESGTPYFVTFPLSYNISGLPASNYWVRAYMDADTNGVVSLLDPAGQYATSAIAVSNRVTGIDITMAEDTDGDGMANWWELLYGLNASTNDALLDPDGDGRTNIEEFNHPASAYYAACILGDSNPTNKDTDADGVTDGPTGGGGAVTNGPDAFPRDACASSDIDCDGSPDALACTDTALVEDSDDDNDGLADGSEPTTLECIIPGTVAPFKVVQVQTASAGNPTSLYASMTVAGNFFGADNWSPPLRNMTLISNQVWEYVHFFTNDTGMEFKFVSNGDWGSADWGDSSQTSSNVPISDTSELESGSNIKIAGKLYGEYRFRFHEGTRAYEIVSAPPVFDLSSSGRILPYANGSNAKRGYGKIHGGIFFNHDGTNLYVGLAGLDPEGPNTFMLFIDSDGTNGGVASLNGLGGDPQNFGTADNISFSSTGFTPNVGILVGDRRFDGHNFPVADLGQGAVGQGIYRLSSTGIFHFAGFSTNIGSGFSQWGDRIAGHRAPNAGIEIRLSLASLGLSQGGFFKAAGLFSGGTQSSPNRHLSGEAYGASITGPFDGSNYGISNVTLIGASVYLSPLAAPPTSGPPPVAASDVILQAFYWDVPTAPSITNFASKHNGIWYDHLKGQVQSGELARFKFLWLPPPSKGRSGRYSVGYDVRDHYDLGAFDEKDTVHTRYGSETDLVELVSTINASGMIAVVDLVMNHMNGGYGATPFRYNFVPWANQTPFTKPDVNGQTNANNYFNYNNKDWPFRIDFGFGTTNELAKETVLNMGPEDDSADINHLHPYMRNGLKTWGAWLTTHVGFGGYRFDFTQGKEPFYTSEFMNHGPMRNKFAVMEYWDTPENATEAEFETWLALTDYRAAAFDMRLHELLEDMCNDPSTFNMEDFSHMGLVRTRPQWAVTFAESHDTVRAFWGDDDSKFGIQQKKELAYALILLLDGTPMIFYHDYFEQPYSSLVTTNGWSGTPLKPLIDPLIDARRKYAAGDTSYLSVSNKQYLYVAKRSGVSTNDGCLLVINNSTSTVLWNTIQTGWTNSTTLVDVLDTNHTASVSGGVATVGASNRSYRVYVRQEIYQP